MSNRVVTQKLLWSALRAPIQLKPDAHNIIDIEAEVVPIIVVPGIMGTRLATAQNECVWDPDAKLHTLLNHVRLGYDTLGHRKVFRLTSGDGADAEYRALNPLGRTVPLPSDAADQALASTAVAGANELVSGVYGLALAKLRAQLHKRSAQSQLCFSTPIFAVGYDWVGPPLDAARALALRVREIIEHIAQHRVCRKAIVVTHSYGGLIARAAMRNFGLFDRTFGVVHVGQPALGAPAAYVHIKAGAPAHGLSLSSYLEQRCFGPDAKHAAALLAFMPGALSLLPFRSDSKAPLLELFCAGRRDVAPHAHQSPFDAIYRRHRYAFGLLDSLDASFEENRCALEHNLAIAEEFHRQLGTWAHPQSLHIAGRNETTFDTIRLELDGFEDCPVTSFNDPQLTELTSYGSSGNFVAFRPPVAPRYTKLASMRILPATGDGDGTVPLTSALGLASEHAQPSFVVENASHATMLSDDRIVTRIAEFIESRLAACWYQQDACA